MYSRESDTIHVSACRTCILGWVGAGPCLPKDAHAMLAFRLQAGCDVPLVQATLDANAHRQYRITQIIESVARGSPALAITARLVARHAHVLPQLGRQGAENTARLVMAAARSTDTRLCVPRRAVHRTRRRRRCRAAGVQAERDASSREILSPA